MEQGLLLKTCDKAALFLGFMRLFALWRSSSIRNHNKSMLFWPLRNLPNMIHFGKDSRKTEWGWVACSVADRATADRRLPISSGKGGECKGLRMQIRWFANESVYEPKNCSHETLNHVPRNELHRATAVSSTCFLKINFKSAKKFQIHQDAAF